MIRSIAAAAMLLLSASAFAQTQTLSTQQVQLLGPQLVLFAGSPANFDSLVTGLTTGAPVTLNTVTADGSLQTVTFMPGTRLAPTDAARILETVRQNLIARGIATPTGDQIAAALVGGTITSPSATSPIAGLLTGSSVPATPVQVRTAAASTPGSTSANLSTAELQAIRNALATGSGLAVVNGTRTGQTALLPQTGLAMSEIEIAQSLQLAATVLAQQGVLDPTADQLRAALFGGTLVTSTGRAVALQGVLQGQVRNTSDSPTVNTSASPSFHTSASPTVNTSATPIRTAPAAASAGQSVTPRTAAQR
jgi:hypothetical protein